MPDPADFGQYKLNYRTGDIVLPALTLVELLALELADFRRAIASEETPRSCAALGVDVVRVVEAVESSLDRMKTVAK